MGAKLGLVPTLMRRFTPIGRTTLAALEAEDAGALILMIESRVDYLQPNGLYAAAAFLQVFGARSPGSVHRTCRMILPILPNDRESRLDLGAAPEMNVVVRVLAL